MKKNEVKQDVRAIEAEAMQEVAVNVTAKAEPKQDVTKEAVKEESKANIQKIRLYSIAKDENGDPVLDADGNVVIKTAVKDFDANLKNVKHPVAFSQRVQARICDRNVVAMGSLNEDATELEERAHNALRQAWEDERKAALANSAAAYQTLHVEDYVVSIAAAAIDTASAKEYDFQNIFTTLNVKLGDFWKNYPDYASPEDGKRKQEVLSALKTLKEDFYNLQKNPENDKESRCIMPECDQYKLTVLRMNNEDLTALLAFKYGATKLSKKDGKMHTARKTAPQVIVEACSRLLQKWHN